MQIRENAELKFVNAGNCITSSSRYTNISADIGCEQLRNNRLS